MSQSSSAPPAPVRLRSQTRMRFVAPPGMTLSSDDDQQTIGRYELVERLGKGAMGQVYKARDPFLDRIVAVKTIVAPKGAGRRVHSAYIERFQREAKAAAKMQHPAIVTIFDVGLHEGAPFMVLEYLPGETLADRLDRCRMPLGRAVQIAMDLASALGFAHRERIVHRDVKPANVLHAGENRWKLADFGIARMPDSDLTQVGIFMGTPGYAPPEAIRQGQYTPQADVFAWGAVLYELLSGRIPYEGPDTQTTNGYVLKATAVSPREHDPSIPEPLAEVVMRALEPATDLRYADGAEAEMALRRAWELCLNSNLVAPSSLVGEEVPHERVAGPMHQLLTPQQPPGAAPAQPQAIPLSEVRPPADRRPVSDEERTTVMPRRDDFPTAVAPAPHAPPQQAHVATAISQESAIEARARATASRSQGQGSRPFEILQAQRSQVVPWMAVAVVAAVVIAVIALILSAT
jgi:eukaryotic-like serine/threonine-protein kinase